MPTKTPAIPDPAEAETPPTEFQVGAALEALRPELLALPEHVLLRRTALDPTEASKIAWGTAIKLRRFREALVAQFGESAGALADSLETTALAVHDADIACVLKQRRIDVTELHARAREYHALLLNGADGLVLRKLLPGEQVERARRIKGHRAVADSLLMLVLHLHHHWPEIEEHTALTADDLRAAAAAEGELRSALARRDHGPKRGPAADLRTRALTKLVRDYTELRRMILFLRFYEGDASEIMPSFWAGRGGRGRRKRKQEATPPPESEPDDPITD